MKLDLDDIGSIRDEAYDDGYNTGWDEGFAASKRLCDALERTSTTSPHFVGFLVGQFMFARLFENPEEAQKLAMKIVEDWNAPMDNYDALVNAYETVREQHQPYESRDWDGQPTGDKYCTDDLEEWPCLVAILLEQVKIFAGFVDG